VKRAERYRGIGRVSRHPTRHDHNYRNRFHPGVQRRLIRQRPFASWSVTERTATCSVAKPMSSLMDVLAGVAWRMMSCSAAAAGRRSNHSGCLDGWMTHACLCIVLGSLPYAAAVTVDGHRMLLCVCDILDDGK